MEDGGRWMGNRQDRWREGLMASYLRWRSSLVEVTALNNSALVVETQIPHRASRAVERGVARWLSG